MFHAAGFNFTPSHVAPMQITELNHIALFVGSVDASARFYGETIGLPSIPRPAFSFPGAWFRIGAQQELHLIGGRLSAPVDENSRGGHFAMHVKDIEAAAKHLLEKGVAFRGPMLRPDGARQIFFEDPDGHLVEFCADPL
jgi:catechol 2,3-dioxygenase-like lactoylglutathione lyase family enzyme